MTFPPLNLRIALECSPPCLCTICTQDNTATSSKILLHTSLHLQNLLKAGQPSRYYSLIAPPWNQAANTCLKTACEGVGRLTIRIAKNVICQKKRQHEKKCDSNGQKDRTETVADIWLVWGSEEHRLWLQQWEQRGAVTKLGRLEETWTLCITLWSSTNLRS